MSNTTFRFRKVIHPEQKKFLDRAFVTNLAQKPAHQGTMLNLLDKTLSVNTEISCPLTVNGETDTFSKEYKPSELVVLGTSDSPAM